MAFAVGSGIARCSMRIDPAGRVRSAGRTPEGQSARAFRWRFLTKEAALRCCSNGAGRIGFVCPGCGKCRAVARPLCHWLWLPNPHHSPPKVFGAARPPQQDCNVDIKQRRSAARSASAPARERFREPEAIARKFKG